MKNPFVVEVREVIIRAIPFYKCSCGAAAEGFSVRKEFSYIPTEDGIKASIGVHSMPVGWASYGREDIRCPRCK